MTIRYDDQVAHSAERIGAAQEAFDQAPAAARLAAWLRLQSWRRLADAQRDHVHWWYSQTLTNAICTCGLLTDLPARPVHTVQGHRNQVGRRPARLLVVPSGPRNPPAHEHAWVVICQGCEYIGHPDNREAAVRTYDNHLSSCPSLRAEQDPIQ